MLNQENKNFDGINLSSGQSVVTESSGGEIPRKLKFAERAQLLLAKYKYINGRGLKSLEAEKLARQDLGLPALAESEINKIKQSESPTDLLEKIADSDLAKKIGVSDFIRENMIFNKKTENLSQNQNDSEIKNN